MTRPPKANISQSYSEKYHQLKQLEITPWGYYKTKLIHKEFNNWIEIVTCILENFMNILGQ